MKPKVRVRAAELNAEPELFQFKANITYLIKSKAQKYHILRDTGYPLDGRADKDSYPHDGRADKDSYPHNGRADKDSYPHDRLNQCIILSL